jgi:hypothetical protein
VIVGYHSHPSVITVMPPASAALLRKHGNSICFVDGTHSLLKQKRQLFGVVVHRPGARVAVAAS